MADPGSPLLPTHSEIRYQKHFQRSALNFPPRPYTILYTPHHTQPLLKRTTLGSGYALLTPSHSPLRPPRRPLLLLLLPPPLRHHLPPHRRRLHLHLHLRLHRRLAPPSSQPPS